MNTLLLKYAVEVEKAGSITQAADNLYMGQPNLSKAIKELEDTLKISIFKRTSKGIVATPKGEEFLKYAKNILSQVDAMEKLCSDDDPNKQLFNISIPRSSYIADAVTNFISILNADKSIDINVQETSSMQAIENIERGMFNLGIIRYQKDYEKYFCDFLDSKKILHDDIWEFKCLTIMSKNHPLADSDELKYEDLKEYIEITHGDTSIPYINSGDVKEEIIDHPKKIICAYERFNQFELLSNIVSSYMWDSPIPEKFIERYDLVQRHCENFNHKYKDVLIYPDGYSFSTLDKKFIDKLYESKNDVALKNYL